MPSSTTSAGRNECGDVETRPIPFSPFLLPLKSHTETPISASNQILDPMTTYWAFVLGTALLVGAGLLAQQRPAPRAVRYNDDIAWPL